MFCFFLLKYPPILLVLVGDGDPDGLSSPPHLLSRGVIAEQGKASQLVLTGDAEICKAEKQDKKGFKRATIATSCPLGSISLLSEHTQGSAAGYTAPSTHRKKQMHRWGPGECREPCMDHPVWTREVMAQLETSHLQVHCASWGEQEEPWEPQRLPFDMGRSEGALGLSVMLQRAAAAGSQAPCSAQLLWDLIPSSCHL